MPNQEVMPREDLFLWGVGDLLDEQSLEHTRMHARMQYVYIEYTYEGHVRGNLKKNNHEWRREEPHSKLRYLILSISA